MGKKLFVGGLSFDTTDIGLRDGFARFGEITEAKVITDRDTGRSRGFGFVTYADEQAVQKAMAELNDWSALGRNLSETISECERAFKEAISIPIAKKKVVFWKKSEPRWQARAKIFTERFGEKHGPWTADAMKKRYVYPAILLEAREIWRSIEKFRAAQDSAFVSGKMNKKPAVAWTEFTQTVVRERNLIENLKTSIRKAEDSLKDASIPPPEKAAG